MFSAKNKKKSVPTILLILAVLLFVNLAETAIFSYFCFRKNKIA